MARCGGGNRGCRHVNWLMYYGQPAAGPTLGYGLLYNWYAATDVRGIAPDGWRVPTEAYIDAFILEVGATNPTAVKGERVVPEDHPRWDSGAGTNSTGLSLYPAGIRSDVNGTYGNFGVSANFWTSTDVDGSNAVAFGVSAFSSTLSKFGFIAKKSGYAIRCVRDTEPPDATVTDIDGNLYNWVQIGTQYWLANNLKTTKYNNGDSIITGLDDAAWAATTDGAWAYPNGDQNLPI